MTKQEKEIIDKLTDTLIGIAQLKTENDALKEENKFLKGLLKQKIEGE